MSLPAIKCGLLDKQEDTHLRNPTRFSTMFSLTHLDELRFLTLLLFHFPLLQCLINLNSTISIKSSLAIKSSQTPSLSLFDMVHYTLALMNSIPTKTVSDSISINLYIGPFFQKKKKPCFLIIKKCHIFNCHQLFSLLIQINWNLI